MSESKPLQNSRDLRVRMAVLGLIDVALSDDDLFASCERSYVIFRAAGILASRMDVFANLPINVECRQSRDNWARSLWYVFSQIYSCEYDVSESYQPFPMEVPGLVPISPSDGYLQPKKLKDIYADYLYKVHGNYWNMGRVVGGNKAVTTLSEYLHRREVTGITRPSRAFSERMMAKRNPFYLRYLQIKPFYPTTSGQWKFWKDALLWVISNYVGGEYRHPVYVHLDPAVPEALKARLEWVIQEYRFARKKERSHVYVLECTACT